ncbi:sporulation/spore germination protein [Calothrix sp. NIES-3974]|uniref:sporulation/spore germination protein n=1 Tax=Calothrix sp. NIES-3974 TaxID=2005462 RepID=UPI000B61A61A|nr:sporulation/spore germination protein [Calothrix sp. NIES-3974]BAZ08025.1 hypothetical protein NIES3974_46940 [Calothrix sp. NIES-3974]
MEIKYRYLLTTTVAIAIAGLSACNTPTPPTTPIPTQTPPESPTAPPSPTPTPNTPTTEPTPPTDDSQGEKKTVKAVIYTIDNECQDFVPEEVTVSAKEPVQDAVGKVIAKTETGDFRIAGYRVSISNGVATIDLRIPPESQRQIASLSSCENNALFGSLRRTLTANSQWNIKDVRFTEKGEEVIF